MLDQSGFGAATKMGGLALDKGPKLFLAPEPFWTSIFTSSASIGADAKRSVSNTFFPSNYINIEPPTLLILPLQSIQIQFSASLNACFLPF